MLVWEAAKSAGVWRAKLSLSSYNVYNTHSHRADIYIGSIYLYGKIT